MSISYEMSLDLLRSEREVYSLFDWVGDLGGLHDGLHLVILGILAVTNYNFYSSYMISQLFTITKKPSSDNTVNKAKSKLMQSLSKQSLKTFHKEVNATIDHTKVVSLKMLIFACIPRRMKHRLNDCRCTCLRRDHKYRVFEEGVKQYEEEIDIVKHLRMQRWLNVAVKKLMSIQTE